MTQGPQKARMLATTIHPTTGAVIDYRYIGNGKMRTEWSTGHRYTMSVDWLNGILDDIRSIGGQVYDYRENS